MDDEDKIHSATTRKLEQLLSTARKFGESIIIANQDPNAIHKCIIGNIRQRLIHKINASDVARNMAEDYNIPFNEMISIEPHNFWFCAEDQYLALSYKYKIEEEEEKEELLEISEERPNNILGYAGLANINEQLAITINFLDAVSVRKENKNNKAYQLEVNRFKKALSAKIGEMCKVEEGILPEYMAYLTCVAYVQLYVGHIPAGSYENLKKFYEKTLCTEISINPSLIPQILQEETSLVINVLKGTLC